MRLSEAKIKQGILHPDAEVRLAATAYFADSYSRDETIMPLVIQAIKEHGRDSAFRILRDAERLVQTAATLDWLLDQLQGAFDRNSVADDNLRFAMALVVLAAPVQLLKERKSQIDALANFPDELRGPLDERLLMANWNSDQGWKALERLAERTMRSGDVSHNEMRHAGRIVESLARNGEEAGTRVLAILRDACAGLESEIMQWLEPNVVDLAGELRLVPAIPMLVEYLHVDDWSLPDSAATALRKIGTDAVVQAIAEEWPDASDDFRGAATDVLDSIHTDLCLKKCLAFLELEEGLDTALALGDAVVSHFAFEGIDPARQLVIADEDQMGPDHFDLRHRLVAAAIFMGTKFPEFDAWHREALETNWGWGDYEPGRLADAFRPDPVGPRPSGNGKH